MDMDSLNKLEEKVKSLVKSLEFLRKENMELKLTLKKLESEKNFNNSEKEAIKQKVTSLIDLIDSIKNEKEGN